MIKDGLVATVKFMLTHVFCIIIFVILNIDYHYAIWLAIVITIMIDWKSMRKEVDDK